MREQIYNSHFSKFFDHLSLTKLEHNPGGTNKIICNAVLLFCALYN